MTKRAWLGVVVPIAYVAAAVAPFAALWSRLPEPMASHWSFGGEPNGALPRVTAFAIHAGVAVLAALGAVVAREKSRSVSASWGVTTFAGVLFAVLGALAVAVNAGAASWRDAGRLPAYAALGAVAIALLAARLVARAARALDRRDAPAEPLPSLGLAPGERAVWTASARNRGFAIAGVAAAIVTAIAGVLVLVAGGHGASDARLVVIASTAAVLALAFVAFAEVGVRIDASGVSIGFGPWRWPRMRVRIARIAAARAIDVAPMANGGWGYRGSLAIFGKAAVVVRRGEGMELTVDGDRKLVITVDDAATGAGLVNDLVKRASNA